MYFADGILVTDNQETDSGHRPVGRTRSEAWVPPVAWESQVH